MANTSMDQINRQIQAAIQKSLKGLGKDICNDLRQEAALTVYSYPNKAYPRRNTLMKPQGYTTKISSNQIVITPVDPPNTWPSVPPATVNKDLPLLIEEGGDVGKSGYGGQHYDFVPVGARPWVSNVEQDLATGQLEILFAKALAEQGLDID